MFKLVRDSITSIPGKPLAEALVKSLIKVMGVLATTPRGMKVNWTKLPMVRAGWLGLARIMKETLPSGVMVGPVVKLVTPGKRSLRTILVSSR